MIYMVLAAGVFAAEYMIRERVNRTRIQGSSRKILGGRLILRNCHNKGLSWPLNRWKTEHVRELSAMMLGGIVWEFFRQLLTGGKRLARLGMALVLGGGVSNVQERLSKGAVTDYVSVGAGNRKFRRLVFNLADVCILAGSLLWALSAILPSRNRSARRAKQGGAV